MNSPRILLWLGAGFSVWAAAFVVIYATQALGCELGWDAARLGPLSLHRAILIVLVLASIGAAFLVARRLSTKRAFEQSERGPGALILTVATCSAYASIAATVFTFSGIITGSICG